VRQTELSGQVSRNNRLMMRNSIPQKPDSVQVIVYFAAQLGDRFASV
jgi:hypothetical protein